MRFWFRNGWYLIKGALLSTLFVSEIIFIIAYLIFGVVFAPFFIIWMIGYGGYCIIDYQREKYGDVPWVVDKIDVVFLLLGCAGMYPVLGYMLLLDKLIDDWFFRPDFIGGR